MDRWALRPRRLRRAAAGGLAALLLLPAACSDASGGDGPDQPGPSSAQGAESSGPSDAPSKTDRPSPEPVLVVVSHATRPPLRLSMRQARRLTSGTVDRWRGQRVVAGVPPRRALAAVEGDPGVLGVVPLEAVRPTVNAATVAGRDPVRGHPDAVTVTVTGDLMLVRGVPDAATALAPMRRLLRAADLTVGNLESTLSRDGAPTQGGDSFGGDPALAGVLSDAGFDAVSLANNHAGDFGPRALLQTVDVLRRRGPVPFGAGADADAAARPAVLTVRGVRFAFLGFNAIGETPMATPTAPGALSVRMPPRTGPFVPADLDRVTAEVRRAQRRADAVVVLPHWGTQYTHAPEPIQRQVARALVEAGADLVVGGHPHWVQGVDAVRGVPVLHSLGNFVFDMDFMEQTMEGVVLETTWWGGELRAIRLVPYEMDRGSFAPRVVTGPAAADVLGDVWSTSTGPFAR